MRYVMMILVLAVSQMQRCVGSAILRTSGISVYITLLEIMSKSLLQIEARTDIFKK